MLHVKLTQYKTKLKNALFTTGDSDFPYVEKYNFRSAYQQWLQEAVKGTGNLLWQDTDRQVGKDSLGNH